MQRTAIQPLDLLPPVEVTFRDYALAVCRSQQLSDPLDPEDYYGMLIEVFRKREILTEDDEATLAGAALSHRTPGRSAFATASTTSRDRAPRPTGSSTTIARTC